MCGRFVMATPVAEIGRLFGVPERPNLAARYNIAPTQEIAVIRSADPSAGDGACPELVGMRWGLVPFWAKDAGIGSKMINARDDTLAEKPAFREAVKRRRCIVPADGFYEWQAVDGRKQPYYIRRRDGAPLAFAGLWESWRGPRDGEPLPAPLLTATIVTTTANGTLRFLHDRMPVILSGEDWRRWIDPSTPPANALSLLRPAADDLLEMVAVSTRVNSVRNEGGDLITPVAVQGALL